MANLIFQGERLAFSGQLKSGQTVLTTYTLKCQVFDGYDNLVQDITCDLDDENSNYYGEIDTSSLLGPIKVRFVAVTPSGDKVVSNNPVEYLIQA